MVRQRINPDTVAKPPGSYQHVIKIPCKTLVFIAGQTPVSPQGNVVGLPTAEIRKIDLETQLRQTYTNIKACLNAAGADFEHVVRLNTYVVATAFNEYRAVSGAIREEFLGGHYPPGATISVVALIQPDVLIEIETIAALDD